jgi:hypothetical protein
MTSDGGDMNLSDMNLSDMSLGDMNRREPWRRKPSTSDRSAVDLPGRAVGETHASLPRPSAQADGSRVDGDGVDGDGVVVPYVTSWTEEVEPAPMVMWVPGSGIGYADEILADRDRHGVLWCRAPSRPGRGRPEFGLVHPLRQRRAMRRLLCQVCAGPADRTEDGVLWLVREFREDWPGWPERMAVTEPPVCRPCAGLSLRVCPALRRGATVFRVRQYPVVGVRGERYAGGELAPRLLGEAMVSYDDRTVRWIRATNLLRELSD